MISKIKQRSLHLIQIAAENWHYGRSAAVRRLNREGVATTSKSKIFFATGFDKSGTTWLNNLLDSHPEMICRASGQFFNYHAADIHYLSALGGYALLTNARQNAWLQNSGKTWIDEDGIESAIQNLIKGSMQSFASANQQYVGDKSTIQDCSLIHQCFPDAPLVAIVRDARDVSVSFALYRAKHGNSSHVVDGKITHNHLVAIAQAWNVYNAHLVAFQQQHPTKIKLIRYEDLLVSTVEIVRELFQFFQVDAADALVQEIVEQNSFRKLSGGRKPGVEDRGSHYRKGISGDWKNYLGPDEEAIFLEHASQMLTHFDYL